MHPGIHNYSEIGKLNKVLLHRIGEEVEGLVPDNFERLLFDDIPFLKVAQQEHDRFAEVLRENGVEVVYYVDETAKALACLLYTSFYLGDTYQIHVKAGGQELVFLAEPDQVEDSLYRKETVCIEIDYGQTELFNKMD